VLHLVGQLLKVLSATHGTMNIKQTRAHPAHCTMGTRSLSRA